MQRPTRITIAAILQFAVSVYTTVAVIPFLMMGAASFNTNEGPPYAIILVGVISGVAGIVAAYGLWKNQRWGKILTVVLRAVDGLAALPGVFFAPSIGWQASAIGGVAVSILIIVLVLWPAPSEAVAQA